MRIRRINSTVPEPSPVNVIECVAGEDILAGTVVIKDYDGFAYCADIYNETHMHRTIGIAKENASIGSTAKIVVTGNLKNEGWDFEIIRPVYCGDKGVPTQVKSDVGFVQVVGIPYEPNNLFVDIEPAILFDTYKKDIAIIRKTLSGSTYVEYTNDKLVLSPYTTVNFECLNTGYSEIEWMCNGVGAKRIATGETGSSMQGPHVPEITMWWEQTGRGSVKARVRDSVTGIWSSWSRPVYVDIA